MIGASLMHEARHPKPVLRDNLEGYGGREAEGGFKMGDTYIPVAIHVDAWQKPSQYCEVIIPQLKSVD